MVISVRAIASLPGPRGVILPIPEKSPRLFTPWTLTYDPMGP